MRSIKLKEKQKTTIYFILVVSDLPVLSEIIDRFICSDVQLPQIIFSIK